MNLGAFDFGSMRLLEHDFWEHVALGGFDFGSMWHWENLTFGAYAFRSM